MAEYVEKKENGELAILKISSKLAGSLQPVELSRADGYVDFNDIMMVHNIGQNASLAVDVGEFMGDENQQLYSTTASTDNSPYTRSAFRIVRYKNETREYREPHYLHYGEQFHLVTHHEFHRVPLYLYSTLKTTGHSSKLAHEQLVAMSTKADWSTVWQVLPVKPTERRTREGDPVPVNAPVIISHCSTNMMLMALNFKYANVFGNEFEVASGKKLDKHKAELDVHHWQFLEGAADSSVVGGPPVNPDDVATGEAIIGQVREILAKRSGGVQKLKDIGKQFHFIDKDRNGYLDRIEMQRGLETFLRAYKLNLTPDEIRQLFNTFDINRDGKVDYNEFLRTLRGDMNDFRKDFVRTAYKLLDKDGSGIVTLDEVSSLYDVSKHPKVLDGSWTEAKALTEFMKQWDQDGDSIITEDDLSKAEKDVQKLTDDCIKKIDLHVEQKEEEIMTV